jgi:NAD-dependent SIR2 family protein deacetylase
MRFACGALTRRLPLPGGLYDRARRRFGLDSGVRLFHGSFFVARRAECCAFLADVCAEAAAARPTRAHHALAALAAEGCATRAVLAFWPHQAA